MPTSMMLLTTGSKSAAGATTPLQGPRTYGAMPMVATSLRARPSLQRLAHQPSLAFVPYLVTGDRFFADEMAFWATTLSDRLLRQRLQPQGKAGTAHRQRGARHRDGGCATSATPRRISPTSIADEALFRRQDARYAGQPGRLQRRLRTTSERLCATTAAREEDELLIGDGVHGVGSSCATWQLARHLFDVDTDEAGRQDVNNLMNLDAYAQSRSSAAAERCFRREPPAEDTRSQPYMWISLWERATWPGRSTRVMQARTGNANAQLCQRGQEHAATASPLAAPTVHAP